MKIKEFISRLEERIPLELEEDWDHSGFQLGNPEEEIQKVYLCLDASPESLREMAEAGANLMVTHHPFFFSPIQDLIEGEPKADAVYYAIRKGLNIYSTHTPFDIVEGGVNTVLEEALGASSTEPLMVEEEKSLGLIGELPKIRLKDLARKLKETLSLDQVILYGDPEREVQRIAWMGGSGMSGWRDALAGQAEVYLTGDVKYHDALDAQDAGLMILDIGHYESEFPAMERLAEIVREIVGEIPVLEEERKLRRHFL